MGFQMSENPLRGEVFIGFSFGNFVSGQIGDSFGRRSSILLAYLMIAAFGFATACSSGPLLMLCLRFCVGAGCGIGFPAAYALAPEAMSLVFSSKTVRWRRRDGVAVLAP